jgi:hypothetical protein
MYALETGMKRIEYQHLANRIKLLAHAERLHIPDMARHKQLISCECPKCAAARPVALQGSNHDHLPR